VLKGLLDKGAQAPLFVLGENFFARAQVTYVFPFVLGRKLQRASRRKNEEEETE
jgi:hypothetical protein